MKKLPPRTVLIVAALSVALLATGLLLRQRAASATSAPAALAQSDTPTAALTVELIAPETRQWPHTLSASGAVAAWEDMVVSPEVGGLRIAELAVDIGQRVAKGQLLARLADDTVRAELQKQEALLAQAEANLQQAAGNLQRAQAVELSGAIAPQKLDEYRANEASARAALASARADLQSARLKMAQTRIVAPDAGLVLSKSGIVGSVASAGTELYRLMRQGRTEWRAELDARQLTAVLVGQSARVELPGGQVMAGQVRLVSPTVSTATGRGIAYVSLGADSAARAGVFASGTIELRQQPALTLPETAVVWRDGRSYVQLVGQDRQVVSHLVTTGRRQNGRVEIVVGLEAATQVVAKGGALLSDGALVSLLSTPAASAEGVSR